MEIEYDKSISFNFDEEEKAKLLEIEKYLEKIELEIRRTGYFSVNCGWFFENEDEDWETANKPRKIDMSTLTEMRYTLKSLTKAYSLEGSRIEFEVKSYANR